MPINQQTVTLPRFDLTDVDIEREAKEAAERIATQRVIRAGRDAWQAIGRAESFTALKSIGAALAVGKAFALRTTASHQHLSRLDLPWGYIALAWSFTPTWRKHHLASRWEDKGK